MVNIIHREGYIHRISEAQNYCADDRCPGSVLLVYHSFPVRWAAAEFRLFGSITIIYASGMAFLGVTELSFSPYSASPDQY